MLGQKNKEGCNLMIFEYIKFNNYRPYYGEQTIYFKNNRVDSENPLKKNIVLIGGLNGHGKTSLINSIHICLYGHRAFKNDKEYFEFLSKSVNLKHVDSGGNKGSIELGFSEENGKYAIEVTFIHGKFDEFRKIYQLNDNLEKEREISLTNDEFYDFIDSRIPIDVAQFFIFDAEKIRDLVGDQDKEETRQAIQKVVSLELYNQLLKDIDKIYNEYNKEVRTTVNDKEIDELLQKIDDITERLNILEENYKEKAEQAEIIREELISLEQERRRLIASSSLTKQKLNKLIGKYEQKLEQIEDDLKFFKTDQLHKIILNKHINKLKNNIKKEKQFVDAKNSEKLKFAPYEEFVDGLLNIDIDPPLNIEQKMQLKLKGAEVWAKMHNIKKHIVDKDINLLHDLSQREYEKLMAYPVTKAIFDLKELVDERQYIEEMLNKYKVQLDDAPEEIDTSEYDEKIQQLNQELGELKAELRNLNIKLSNLRNEKFKLSADYEKKARELKKLGPLQKKINLLNKLYNGTKDFIEEVTMLKAKQLKIEIERILGQLFRKEDFQQIIFDEEKFILTIIDPYNNPIDLNTRSEGEKQLIALAMIWALTKVSGSNFPFVIDTPLARLDSIHRSNLVDYYFTKLSDQVIILSTDTEITEDFYIKLKPFIQTEYTLEYDPIERHTSIDKGYFFSEEDEIWRI